MIAYYHIYLEIPFFAINHVSITYQMLFERGPNLKHLQNKIQQDLDNINKWCSTWGFLLSPNKTVGIIFSRKRNLGSSIISKLRHFTVFDTG
jgi:hypothetical protein